VVGLSLSRFGDRSPVREQLPPFDAHKDPGVSFKDALVAALFRVPGPKPGRVNFLF
jgi:hypothetical protein